MIAFTATDSDGYTVTVYSGSHPHPDGTEQNLGIRTRVAVADPGGDYICCDLGATEQARLAAVLTGSRQPLDE